MERWFVAEVFLLRILLSCRLHLGRCNTRNVLFLVFKGNTTLEIFMLFEMSRYGQRVTFVESGRMFRLRLARLRLRQLRSSSMMACHRLVKTSESATWFEDFRSTRAVIDNVWWWRFQIFCFVFHHYLGEDEPILTHIFQMGWNHQLVMFGAIIFSLDIFFGAGRSFHLKDLLDTLQVVSRELEWVPTVSYPLMVVNMVVLSIFFWGNGKSRGQIVATSDQGIFLNSGVYPPQSAIACQASASAVASILRVVVQTDMTAGLHALAGQFCLYYMIQVR